MKGRQQLGGGGHHSTATTPHFNQPFLTQILVGVKHRVQIDAKGCRHFPRRRKAIARLQSAGGGIGPHRRSQLLEQRRIACVVDAEQHPIILQQLAQC